MLEPRSLPVALLPQAADGAAGGPLRRNPLNQVSLEYVNLVAHRTLPCRLT